MPITWKMEGGFTEGDFRNLGSGMLSPDDVFKIIQDKTIAGSLNISDPKVATQLVDDIATAYAGVFASVYKESAEDYAAYAVARMFQNLETINAKGGGDMAIMDTLMSKDKFFEVDKDKKWTTSPRGYTISGKNKINSGLYGSFLEQELFGLQPGQGREARFGDLSEALHGSISQQDVKSKSHKSGEKPVLNVDVGGVKFNLNMEMGPRYYERNLPPGVVDFEGAKRAAIEQGEELRIKFAEALKEKEIYEYIIGRTLGIFKLFEKVAGVLLFGVEVQEHDVGGDRAIFRYTSATTYAKLRYDAILDEIRTNPQHTHILGAVNVSVKYVRPPEGEVIMKIKDWIFGQLEIDVTLLTDALKPNDVNDVQLGTKLYKEVYNIFSNVQEKTNFFKAMYSEFQQNRDIATNIEIQYIKEQMRNVKMQSRVTRRKSNSNSVRR